MGPPEMERPQGVVVAVDEVPEPERDASNRFNAD